MKLTEQQINYITESLGDNETCHGRYDELVTKRLEELDPEFLSQLDEIVKNVDFWYA